MKGPKEKAGETAKPSKTKRICGLVLDILFFCFFLVCVFALFVSVTAKRSSDGSVELFGYEMRIVISPSMEKCEETDVSGYEIKDIPVKSLVWIRTVPKEAEAAQEWYGRLKAGDVLTFRYVYETQETITHRIVEITPKETGGYIIVLQGDNKTSEGGVLTQTIDTSQEDSPNYIIGKVTGKNYVLGLLITALKSPWGIVFIVIVPSALIIVQEVIRIVSVLSQKKKAEAQEAQKKKDEEIEELKKQLATANARLRETEILNSGVSSDEDKK